MSGDSSDVIKSDHSHMSLVIHGQQLRHTRRQYLPFTQKPSDEIEKMIGFTIHI